jgi:predicted glutamine amidotransferase
MCGIVGVAGKIGANEDKVFKNLLYMDELRGPHSTGVAAVAAVSGTATHYKRAIGASDFLASKRGSAIIQQSNRVLIGHNRYKTAGSISHANAHPFEHGDVLGVHNGTLSKQSLLPDHTHFEVDSDNIFHALNEAEDVSEVSSKLEGAYALVWWDKRDKSLNFLRNPERTLYIAKKKNSETIFWASEKFMLMAAMDRNNIVWEEIQPLPVHTHLKFVLDSNSNLASFEIPKPAMKEVPFVEKPKTLVTGRGWTTKSTTQSGTGNQGSTVKKQPALSRASNDSGVSSHLCVKPKVFLEDHGLTYSSSVDFIPIEQRGVRVIGMLIGEADLDVSITCPTEKQASLLLEAVNNGHYFTLRNISGIIHSSEEHKDGALLGYFNNCTMQDYASEEAELEVVDTPEPTIANHRGVFITEEEFDKSYHDCAYCSSPVFFSDVNLVIISAQDALCGACATQPTVREMCNL